MYPYLDHEAASGCKDLLSDLHKKAIYVYENMQQVLLIFPYFNGACIGRSDHSVTTAQVPKFNFFGSSLPVLNLPQYRPADIQLPSGIFMI